MTEDEYREIGIHDPACWAGVDRALGDAVPSIADLGELRRWRNVARAGFVAACNACAAYDDATRRRARAASSRYGWDALEDVAA